MNTHEARQQTANRRRGDDEQFTSKSVVLILIHHHFYIKDSGYIFVNKRKTLAIAHSKCEVFGGVTVPNPVGGHRRKAAERPTRDPDGGGRHTGAAEFTEEHMGEHSRCV